ncbi:MAG TPA: hypothetical protein VFD58_24590 [Blastocatellia bacterium]|nr:hypothetical protein [Blastocatellia bacterium]
MSGSDKSKYQVFVDDNSHYMDESERYTAGVFDDCESAVRKCIEIVESSLMNEYKRGMGAKELVERYKSFGDDPWISGPDAECRFSAWEYAERRAKEICTRGGRKQDREG